MSSTGRFRSVKDPAQKPLALVERAIENSSTPGATVPVQSLRLPGGCPPLRASRQARVLLRGSGSSVRGVLELALADTLELENTVPRTRALTQLVSVAARVVQETTAWEARLRALEDGVWRETPDAGP